MMRDIYALLQVYAEGIDFMEPLPDMVNTKLESFLLYLLFGFFPQSLVDLEIWKAEVFVVMLFCRRMVRQHYI